MQYKVFLDTNVVLDLLGERENYYHAAARIATLADKGEIQLVVSALTYATVYYLLSKYEKAALVKEKVQKFKVLAETADLSDKVIEQGLASNFADFEDALQYYCAIAKGCDVLISRNEKDFKMSNIPVLSPTEYLSTLQSKGD